MIETTMSKSTDERESFHYTIENITIGRTIKFLKHFMVYFIEYLSFFFTSLSLFTSYGVYKLIFIS